jgi:hypothetical protein
MGEKFGMHGKQETHTKLGWEIQEDKLFEEQGAYRILKMDNGGNSSETLNCFLLVQDTVHW